MILGGNRGEVIENIKAAASEGRWHDKVEVNDADMTHAQKLEVADKFMEKYGGLSYKVKNWTARAVTLVASRAINRDTVFEGLENLDGLKGGAVVTSNHFNQLENTAVHMAMRKAGKRKLYIVSQETNFAVDGPIGFLMKYADTIPLTIDVNYMKTTFITTLRKLLKRGEYILIYPEQEMWFNYRKPRPLKRRVYYYAALCNAPIVSCFVEIRVKDEKDTDEFYKTAYIVHVLPPIYPQEGKSVHANSMWMMNKDYAQKKEAYEKAYGKKLSYEFEPDDIAGWIHSDRIDSDELQACQDEPKAV